MPDREQAIRAFLARSGWADARREPLAGDASFRRYERLYRDDRTVLLMDAPPPHEDVRPFVHIARHLLGLGYSAPEIFAEDEEAGLLLLEDFGDDSFTAKLQRGDDESVLYSSAVDILIDLTAHPLPENVPPYDEARLLEEVERVLDWYMPVLTGDAVAPETREDYRDRWRQVLGEVDRLPTALVLLDYHVDNLMWLKDREGLRRIGLLDFQDALAGSPVYDLVSLLQDARRDVPAALAESMLRRYIDATGLEDDAVRTAYALLGAQRNARLVGQFPRLWVRDGKPQYLRFMPRVWSLLTMDLTHPHLAPVAAWFDRHVPPEQRGQPLPGAPS